jgi:hypothetical protein
MKTTLKFASNVFFLLSSNELPSLSRRRKKREGDEREEKDVIHH